MVEIMGDVRSRSPTNYDAWFDYIRLEESAGDVPRTRELYERAIAATPPAAEKRYWQRRGPNLLPCLTLLVLSFLLAAVPGRRC